MAIRYAVATGNWSDVSTWDGGVSLPTVGDDVYANGFTVTLDQDIVCTKISTEICPTTSVAGGVFKYGTGTNLVCDVYAGYSTCLDYQSVTLSYFYLIGNIYGSTSTACYGVHYVKNSTIVGNVYGGDYSLAWGIFYTYASYGINIIGNIYGGVGGSGLQCGDGTTITGNIIAGEKMAVSANKSIIVNGNIYGGANAVGLSLPTLGYYLYINGNLINSIFVAAMAYQIISDNLGTITFKNSLSEDVILYTEEAFDQPDEADVRLGTSYASATLTGTLAVPDPSTVNEGVPTDDTVGTGTNGLTSEIIERLRNCSTVQITGQQIAAYNGAPAELIPTYAKRDDFVGNVMYLGAAPVGTLDSSDIWTLSKSTIAIDGTISSELYATDSWDNHLTAIYS